MCRHVAIGDTSMVWNVENEVTWWACKSGAHRVEGRPVLWTLRSPVHLEIVMRCFSISSFEISKS